jgi:hypothetical protein
MRRWRRSLGLAVLAGLLGSPAEAGPLASAALEIRLGGQPVVFPAAGATGTATDPLSVTLGAGSAFAGTDVITLPASQQPFSPVDRLHFFLSSNGAGSFTGSSPAQVAGAATFVGAADLSATTLVPCCSDPFLRVPFKVGKQTTFTKAGAGLVFTVFSAPWTAGKATVTGVDPTSATVFATGMNALSPGGAGALTLVSPGKVLISSGNKLPFIGTLTLAYVPEPATLLLLGAGALALGALGRARRPSGST